MSDIVSEAITEYWGERCPDFNPNCPTCKAWAEYEELTTLRAVNDALSEQMMTMIDNAGKVAELPDGAGVVVEAAARIERLEKALRDVHAAAGNNHLIANIARAALEGK